MKETDFMKVSGEYLNEEESLYYVYMMAVNNLKNAAEQHMFDKLNEIGIAELFQEITYQADKSIRTLRENYIDLLKDILNIVQKIPGFKYSNFINKKHYE